MVGRTIARSQSMTAAVPAAAGERLLAGVLAALLMSVMLLAGIASAATAQTEGEQEPAQQEEPAQDEPAQQEEGDEAEEGDDEQAPEEAPAEGDFDITVTPDDDSGVAEGDEVTFTIEAINNGDEAADVDVTHAVPAGFEHVSSDPEGEAVGQEMV